MATTILERPGLTLDGARGALLHVPQGSTLVLHPLWLRERSRAPAVFDAQTAQRLYDASDLDPDLAITAVSEEGPGRYRVRFSDGHEWVYPLAELVAEASIAPGADATPPLRLWESATEARAEPVRWRADPSPAELASWLEQFLALGFIVLTGLPTAPETVLRVAERFGFTRRTNFGELFDVRSTPDAVDLAYTALALDPHTDNPYRAPVPGIQLLHCLVNETSGGLSTLVDGFAAAERLRRDDPQAFEVLARTPVQFRYRDARTALTASAPLIELDVTGAPVAVRFSPRLDYVPLLPVVELSRFYRARRALDRLLRSHERELRFLLGPGDLMMMDNQRVLHGRTGYDPGEGARHLQGCYIDRDTPRSLYRVIRREARA